MAFAPRPVSSVVRTLLFSATIAALLPLAAEAADYAIFSGGGGDCELFLGSWATSTQTCTLERNVYGSIAIFGHDVTLDGAGHAIVGPGIGYGSGVEVAFPSGAALLNFRMTNVTLSGWGAGVYLYRAYNARIASTTIAENIVGVVVGDSPFLTVADTLVSKNRVGLTTVNAFAGLALHRVAFNDNTDRGVALVPYSVFVGNDLSIDTSNTINGKPILYFENRADEVHEHLGEIAMLMCQQCRNMTFGHFSIDGGNGLYGTGIDMWYSNDNTVHHATTDNVKTGVSLSSSERNTFYNNTFHIVNHTPDQGPAVGVVAGVFNSNYNWFLDNNFIEAEPATSATRAIWTRNQNSGSTNYFYSPLLERGNYWSRFDTPAEGCTDIDSDRKCDSTFYLDDGGPYPTEMWYAWASENAWDAPQESATFWTAITNAPQGALSLRESPNTSATIVKQLPNGWALKVLTTTSADDTLVIADGFRWYEVEDATDGTQGWMAAGTVDGSGTLTETYLAYDPARQDELEDKASRLYASRAERVEKISEAVAHYYADADTAASLYASNDGTNDLSVLEEGGFPQELVLAIFAQESGGIDYDNEHVSYDYGHGIAQVTFKGFSTEPDGFLKNDWDNRGIGSGVVVPTCASIRSKAYYDCYAGAGTGSRSPKPYKPYQGNQDNTTYKQYANTAQSIYANVKDGLRVLQEKYQLAKNAKAVTIGGVAYSKEDMQNISATYRYNQGSPYNVQAVYMVFEGKLTLEQIQQELISHGASASWVRNAFDAEWVEKVKSECQSIDTFTDCLSVSNEVGLTTSAFYLRDVANHLDISQAILAKRLIKANESAIVLWLRSPGELQVVDAAGSTTGVVEGTAHEDVPNSFFDPESGFTLLFGPDSETAYRVTGTAAGTYGLVITDLSSSTTVAVVDIPTTNGAVHEYHIDWSVVAAGEEGVTVKIDKEGDGVFEKELKAGATFIDTEPPEAVVSFDSASRELTIAGIDALSSQVLVVAAEGGYTLTDESGNTTTLVLDRAKDTEKNLTVSIVDLNYHGAPLAPLPENTLHYDWAEDKDGALKHLTQKIVLDKTERVRAEYDAEKDETKLFVKTELGMQLKEMLPGLALFRITTNHGELDVAY